MGVKTREPQKPTQNEKKIIHTEEMFFFCEIKKYLYPGVLLHHGGQHLPLPLLATGPLRREEDHLDEGVRPGNQKKKGGGLHSLNPRSSFSVIEMGDNFFFTQGDEMHSLSDGGRWEHPNAREKKKTR